MRRIQASALALAIAATASMAEARTIICIPEVAATAVDRNGRLEAGNLDTSSKFILSDESGAWVVREHPSSALVFTNCVTEFFCDGGEMFAGALMRIPGTPEQQSSFTAFWMMNGDNGAYANVARGYCSEL